MYIVRIATLDDLPILLEFEQGVIEAERPMDPTIKAAPIHYYNIPELINSDQSEVFVSEINGEIIASGYAKIKPDRHYLKHQNQGYLGFMFVKEDHRGKGINQMILNALINWCKGKEIIEIRLDVYDSNENALKAYKKAGFKNHMIQMRMDITDFDV